MALRGGVVASMKDDQHGKVISMLIDHLSSHGCPENDEALLATTVILRMSEQFCEIKEDALRHLSGAASLFTLRALKRKWSVYETDLAGVSFWIYLRATLRLCFLNQEPCQFELPLISEEVTFGIASDDVWTNRMTYLLCRACNICFGKNDPIQQQQQAKALEILLEKWRHGLPASFQPWCHKQTSDTSFPEIHLLNTWHGQYPIMPSRLIIDF